MTSELEKQFFETFGIEPETGIGLIKFQHPHYPQITDRILLGLICILNRYFNATGEYPIMLLGLDYEALKEHILKRCIHNEYNIKHQVRTLFEEE